MTTRTAIALKVGLGVAAIAAIGLTVANRAWWIARIKARWVMQRWEWLPELNRWELNVEAIGPTTTIPQLASLWRKGSPGWYRVGEQAPPIPQGKPADGIDNYGPSPVGTGEFLEG